jgi:hypothetical protein
MSGRPRDCLPTGSARWERRSEQLIARKAGAEEGTRKPPSPMPAALPKEKQAQRIANAGAAGWFPESRRCRGCGGRGGAKRNRGGERRMAERLPRGLRQHHLAQFAEINSVIAAEPIVFRGD